MNEQTPTTWIPVTERLPEPKTPVLIHYGNGSTAIAMRYEFDGLKFVSVDGPANYKPSHWQPLPPPPPKPDAFETWWSKHDKARTGVGEWRSVGTAYTVHQETARAIWDAAIASTNQ